MSTKSKKKTNNKKKSNSKKKANVNKKKSNNKNRNSKSSSKKKKSKKDKNNSNLTPSKSKLKKILKWKKKDKKNKSNSKKKNKKNDKKKESVNLRNESISNKQKTISSLSNQLKSEKNANSKLTQQIKNKNRIIMKQNFKIEELENEIKQLKIKYSKNKKYKNINKDISVNNKATVKKLTNIDINNELSSKPDILVYGYINSIQLLLLKSVIIPIDIINICYLFYYQDMNLLLLSGSKNVSGKQWNELQYVKLYHIDKKYEKYYVNVVSLNDNNNNNNNMNDDDAMMDDNFDRFNYAGCMLSHISLPKWNIMQKYEDQIYKYNYNQTKIGKYQTIIRCGGQYSKNDDYVTNECDIILFNSDNKDKHNKSEINTIKGYHISLPKLPQNLTKTSVIYNENESTLYCIGGCIDTIHEFGSKSIYYLQLDTLDESKWKSNGNVLNQNRLGSSLCLLDDLSVIAIIGGKTTGFYQYSSSVEFYDINLKKVKHFNYCSNMTRGRYLCGSCYNNINGNTIIVGGGIGFGTATSVEIYDITKNKWTALKYETNYPHHNPFIMNDIYNPNIIYIGGNSIGNHQLSHLGYIEWIDIRDNTRKFWNYLFDKPLQQLFDLENDIPMQQQGIWKSRSLMLN